MCVICSEVTAVCAPVCRRKKHKVLRKPPNPAAHLPLVVNLDAQGLKDLHAITKTMILTDCLMMMRLKR